MSIKTKVIAVLVIGGVAVFGAGIAMVMNPNRGDHAEAIAAYLESEAETSALGQLSNWIGTTELYADEIEKRLTYKNYALYSVTSIDGKRLTVGGLGSVRVVAEQ